MYNGFNCVKKLSKLKIPIKILWNLKIQGKWNGMTYRGSTIFQNCNEKYIVKTYNII